MSEYSALKNKRRNVFAYSGAYKRNLVIGHTSDNYIALRQDINEKKSSSLLIKIIHFFCYMTFGLAGLILLMSYFINGSDIERETIIHTIQAIIIAMISGIIIALLAVISSLSVLLTMNTGVYNIITLVVYGILPVMLLAISSIFGLTALAGYTLVIPGLGKTFKNFKTCS